ncbi:Pvc16 family protein [Streptomyces lavendulae]|uniref:Pvc16 family protein n=1 Tax=Streptomyces lavendulae TaxID=1914 RepID=UPI00340102EC
MIDVHGPLGAVMRGVDAALEAILKGAVEEEGVDVTFKAPTRENAPEGKEQILNAYLYDMREDERQRGTGEVTLYRLGEDGPLTTENLGFAHREGVFGPLRYLTLSYVVTMWTDEIRDAHATLAKLFALFTATTHLKVELDEYLTALGASVAVSVTPPKADGTIPSEFWLSVGNTLSPSLHLTVTAPVTFPVPEPLVEVEVMEVETPVRPVQEDDEADESTADQPPGGREE